MIHIAILSHIPLKYQIYRPKPVPGWNWIYSACNFLQCKGNWEQGERWWHQVADILGCVQRFLPCWVLCRPTAVLGAILLVLQGEIMYYTPKILLILILLSTIVVNFPLSFQMLIYWIFALNSFDVLHAFSQLFITLLNTGQHLIKMIAFSNFSRLYQSPAIDVIVETVRFDFI